MPPGRGRRKKASRPVAGACNGFAQPLQQQSPATANGRSNGLVSNGNCTTAGGTAVGSPPGSLSPTSPPATTPPKTGAKLAVTSTGSPMDEMRMAEIALSLPSHFPRRPAHGTLGRLIQLVTNHFDVDIPNGNVYHYDVEICSETSTKAAKVPEQKKYRCLSTRINRTIIELLVKKYQGELSNCIPAFDGRKNLYTRRQLNFRERIFAVDLEEGRRVQRFTVKVQYAATVNLDALQAMYQNRVSNVPQEVLQAIDTVVRHGPSIKLTPVGRSFFTPPYDTYALGGGREVWFGYYTSVRPAQWKPMLNLDVSATAFYEPLPLVSFMCKIFSDSGRRVMTPSEFRSLTQCQYTRLNKELKGLRVKVTHLSYPRKYKVVRVTRRSAMAISFDTEDGATLTVSEYFGQRYAPLQYPHFPCVQCGRLDHPVYIPFEVCELVEGQHCRKKLDENQTTRMIKCTSKPPAKRFQEIRQSVHDLVNTSQDYLREFGIKISTNPTQLRGRVLDPPSLVFEQDKVSKPRDGTWDLRGQHFYNPATMDCWTVVSMSHLAQRDSVDNFVKMLLRIGKELGMHITQPLAISTANPNSRSIRFILAEQLKNHSGLQMVVIILAKSTNYAEIKQVAETELGLRTQCVRDSNVIWKCNVPLVQNLLQKINTKMGGTNNSLLLQEKPLLFRTPVIVIGADVSHPSPGDWIRPSIAACVGSLDATPSKFSTSIRVQMGSENAKGHIEIIQDLKEMIKNLLRAFYRSTRQKPQRIIFYRDGVSESQFLEVRNREVSAIRLACKEMSPNDTYEPPLTFIVVQKRHHTRFMPANEREGVGKCRNVPPGTTVDTVVTHPLDFDFFLCSHFGIQGTSRPAHYYVVWDDSNFTADELQRLTYYLCHTYARCARSVSIPAPVYYAHLAAFRAKTHIVSKVDVASSGSDSSGGSGDNVPTIQYVEAVRVLDKLQTSMYFV